MALVVAACGGGGSDKKTSSTTKTSGNTASGTGNGTLTVGAEQDATCADWINTCAGSLWGSIMMGFQSMPRVFDYAKQGGVWTEVPNPMSDGMPTVATVNGKQTVTYKISPNAVWSDGQPITSEDFKYTWDQIAHGKNIYNTTGYAQIESIDTTNPKVAVVTFAQPYASWTSLFSADYGIMPSHLLQGKNRHALMVNGYSWSGGPWSFKWDKGVSVTLAPNPRWYGPKPTVQKVIFRIISNTASEFEAFKGDQVSAIYPSSDPSAVAEIKGGTGDVNSDYTADTASVEALYINNAKFPFDSVAVRQAFGYSIDRDAIVKRLFGDLGITKAVQTLNPPTVSKYADTQAFANYVLNLDKVNSLMSGDGWTKTGGYWTKNGKTAAFTLQSTAGDKRRALTEQIIQEEMRTAGFKMSIKNPSADNLFNKVLPAGAYQVALYGLSASDLNPSLCDIFCSDQIPSKANDFSGQNYQWTNIPALDTQLKEVQTNFDEQQRIAASKQGDQLTAQNQVSLPLDPLPNIALWSKQITGPVGDNPILSMYWNLFDWRLAG
jgi:peptide/nickel transport system substrate-binding protein